MRALALLMLTLLVALPAAAQPARPVVVDVELYVINFGNYDPNKGTYTMDFYLHLSYDNGTAPPGFDVTRFEFMNGRAASRDLLSDDAVGGVRNLWYRVQANLLTDPRFQDYPYDHQVLWLALEDSVHPVGDLMYRSAVRGTGLDPAVRVAGWRIDNTTSSVSTKSYALSEPETYSRFTYEVHVSRPAFSATMRTFLPPLAFILVASFSFFLDPAQPVPRLTLGTGMLISAVGFHLSQMVNLPAPSTLTPFDKFMVSTYAFIACCIMVTVALAWGDKLRIPAALLKVTNRWGAAGAVAVPVLLWAGLSWL